ncbi:MAG: SusD/RagB family nutrient-binding outer membrane lipoprotein [Flavobacterium sp.]|nr:SusD/RagB family nutrient-binding outer membrane lipoprotein [Flavobacterium sp.]
MKNIILKLFVFAVFISLSSCETIDLDQTENPSTLSQDFIDPTYTFNFVQLQLPDFVNSANSFTQRVTRQMAMTSGNSYDNAFEPVNFNDNWGTGYKILNAIKIMEPKAYSDKKFYELGAAKVIRCYVLLTLVDMYGDIPYFNALEGSDNITPNFDSSKVVYNKILEELDVAISILNDPLDTSENTIDLYYGGKASWITLANTLKLKMFITARNASNDINVPNIATSISTIVNSGDFIDSPSKDFVFKYGNSRNSPNTRHPLYNDQYELGGGAYIGNYMMWTMCTEKDWKATNDDSNNDPRLHFYFYKQKENPADYNADTFTLPGRSRPAHYNETKYASFFDNTIFTCYVVSNWVSGTAVASSGFWGRDHGDNSGIPPDSDKRTVCGVYPIGGAYGTAGTVQTSGTKGAKGAGIMPILLSSYVSFLIAEASLTVPGYVDPVRAKTFFLLGIDQSVDKVTSFNSEYINSVIKPNQLLAVNANKVFYHNFMSTKFDVSSNNKKLELIIKEYYIAAWGNGIEPYNNYRRTGFPSNFQPTIIPSSSPYFSTAYYPASAVNNNPNIPNNLRTRKVFWDNLSITLH